MIPLVMTYQGRAFLLIAVLMTQFYVARSHDDTEITYISDVNTRMSHFKLYKWKEEKRKIELKYKI